MADAINLDSIRDALLAEKLQEQLSGAAYSKIVAVIERCKSLEDALENAGRDLESNQDVMKEMERNIEGKNDAIDDLCLDIDGWKEREGDLLARESNALRHELIAEYSEKRVEDHQAMFQTVFRNTTLRNSVMDNVPVKMGGSTQYGSDGRSIAVEGGETLMANNSTTETTEV